MGGMSGKKKVVPHAVKKKVTFKPKPRPKSKGKGLSAEELKKRMVG